jgi:hypothetical protein
MCSSACVVSCVCHCSDSIARWQRSRCSRCWWLHGRPERKARTRKKKEGVLDCNQLTVLALVFDAAWHHHPRTHIPVVQSADTAGGLQCPCCVYCDNIETCVVARVMASTVLHRAKLRVHWPLHCECAVNRKNASSPYPPLPLYLSSFIM